MKGHCVVLQCAGACPRACLLTVNCVPLPSVAPSCSHSVACLSTYCSIQTGVKPASQPASHAPCWLPSPSALPHSHLSPAAPLGGGSGGGAARSKLHLFVEWLPLQELVGEGQRSAASGAPSLRSSLPLLVPGLLLLLSLGQLHLVLARVHGAAPARGWVAGGRALHCESAWPATLHAPLQLRFPAHTALQHT